MLRFLIQSEPDVRVFLSKTSFSFHLEILSSPGIVMSPNHPQFYPSNQTSTHHVTVETGLILSIEFTAFDIKQVTGARGQCHSDYLLVTDGDGTVLLEKSCGWPGRLQLGDERVDLPVPPKMKSRSNTVNFIFSVAELLPGYVSAFRGWSVRWRADIHGDYTANL